MNRILMISTHGYFEAKPSFGLPDTGGQVAYVIELSLALAKYGYNVDILTRKFQDFPQTEDVGEKVRIVRASCGGRDFIPKEYLVEHLSELVDGFVEYCRDNGLTYDFIDSHYWDAGVAGMELAGIFSIPHIFTPHSIGIWKKMEIERAAAEQSVVVNEEEFESQHNFKRRIETEKTIMNHANKVIATSPQQQDIICDRYGISHEKVAVVTPGFNPDKYQRMETHSLSKAIEKHSLPPRFVLAVGRITEYKGYDLLLKAMKYVIEEVPDIKLVLRIGSQELPQSETQKKNELLQMAQDLGLTEHILFHDYVEEIEDFYNELNKSNTSLTKFGNAAKDHALNLTAATQDLAGNIMQGGSSFGMLSGILDTVASTTAGAFDGLASTIPVVGDGLGKLGGAAVMAGAAVAGFALAQFDNIAQSFDQTAEAGNQKLLF